MQIMYALTFIIMIFTSMVSLAHRDSAELESKSDAVAWQMTAWHRAAVDMCKATTCTTGILSPFNYLSEPLRNGKAFTNGAFVAVYNAPNRTLLTFMSGKYQRADLSYGSVAAALSETLDDPSNEIGTFNGSVIVPFRPLWQIYIPGRADSPATPTPLSGSFAGNTVPIGSPVMLSYL